MDSFFVRRNTPEQISWIGIRRVTRYALYVYGTTYLGYHKGGMSMHNYDQETMGLVSFMQIIV